MKYFYSLFILVLMCIVASAQPLPIMRNAMSTNVAGTPVLSRDDLSVTNVGGGTNWLFFGVVSQTVARLQDVWGSTGSVSLLAVTNVITVFGPNMFIIITNGVGTNTTFYATNYYGTNVFSPAASFVGGVIISNSVVTNQLMGGTSNLFGLILIGTNAGYYVEGGDGDVNGSGNLTAADITAIRAWIRGGSDTYLTNSEAKARGDIDGNGMMDFNDAIIARRVILNITNLTDAKHEFQRERAGSYGIDTNRSLIVGTREMVIDGRETARARLEVLNTNTTIADFMVQTNQFSMSNAFGLFTASVTFSNEPDGNTFGAIFTGTNGGIYVEGGGGDINGSGTVTIADETAILNWVTLATGSDTYLTNAAARARADIDGNGVIDFNDWILAGYLKNGTTDVPTLRRSFQRKLGGIYGVDYTNEMFIVGTRQLAVGSRPYGMAKVEILNTNRTFSDFMINTNEFVVSNHLTTANGSVDIYTNLAVRGSNFVAGQSYFGNTVYVDGAGSGLEVDGLTVTNGITNFGTFSIRDNAVSNALWRCTNTATGQGTWANNYLNSTEVSNLVSSVAYGQTWFVWGSSNTLATNAAGTPYKAMLKGDTPLPATANTNTYTTPTAGQYVGEVITAIPAGISLIVPGDIVTESFAYLSENRTMVLQPEIYIRTNMIAPSFSALGELEVAVGPSFTVNNTFQSFAVNIPVTTNIVLSTTNYLVRKLRVVSVSGGTPNLLLVSQDGYPARVTFPIASSSFVLKSGDTMQGTLVLTNSYNVGNSFESRSTNANSQQFGSNTISGVGSIALGVNAKSGTGSIQSNSVAIGFKTEATNESTIAIGYNTHVGGNFSVGIGDGVTSGYGTSGSNSVAIGESSSIQSDYAIAIGSEASVAGSSGYGIAIGTLSTSGGSSAIAIGKSANASHANAIAIGDSVTTTGNNEFVLGLSTHAVTIPGIVNITGYVTNNIKYTTNAAVNGAVVDMKFSYQTTNAAGAITYTGLSNTDPNRTLTTSLFIDANGADRLITIPASWKNHQVSTTFTVTNGWVGVLTICQYGNVMTNVAWTLIK